MDYWARYFSWTTKELSSTQNICWRFLYCATNYSTRVVQGFRALLIMSGLWVTHFKCLNRKTRILNYKKGSNRKNVVSDKLCVNFNDLKMNKLTPLKCYIKVHNLFSNFQFWKKLKIEFLLDIRQRDMCKIHNIIVAAL